MKPCTLPRCLLLALFTCTWWSGLPSVTRAAGLDTWTLRNPKFTTEGLQDVTFGAGTFVAVGEAGSLLASPNGVNWSVQRPDPALQFIAVAFGNGRFVALSYTGSLLTSSDGTNWNSRYDSPFAYALSDVTFGNGQFAAIGASGNIAYSTDGLIWGNRTVALSGFTYSITTGNGLFVAVGSPSTVHVSSNLVDWSSATLPGPATAYFEVTRGNNLFVAVGNNGQIVTSTNGTNWASQSSGGSEHLGSITYGNGRFVAPSLYSPLALVSTNGTNWAALPTGETYGLNGVAFGNGGFVAVGSAGIITTATDPSMTNAWTNRSSITSDYLLGVAYGNGTFVAVGGGGAIVTSAGGSLWARQSSGTNVELYAAAFGGGRFVAVGEQGTALYSANGTNWTAASFSPSLINYLYFRAVTYGGSQFVAVGSEEDPEFGGVGVAYTSPDGANWTRRSLPTRLAPRNIAYGNGRFVALLGDDEFSSSVILTSTDAVNWRCVNMPASFRGQKITFGNGQFLALGYTYDDDEEQTSERFAASIDGENWFVGNPVNLSLDDVYALAAGGGTFVAVGYNESNAVSSSSSGIVWTNRPTPPGTIGGNLYGLTFGAGTFVAVGAGGIILQSGAVSSAPAQAPSIVQQPQSLLVHSGETAGFAIGVDGSLPLRYQWRRNGVPLAGATNSLLIISNALPVNNGLYSVAVTNDFGGTVSASAALTVIEPDPLDYWQLRQSGLSMQAEATLNSVAFGNNVFVAVGNNSVIITSVDGATWLRRLPPQPFNAANVAFGAGKFLANENYDFSGCPQELISLNGSTWTNPIPPSTGFPGPEPVCLPGIKSVAFGGGKFVAVGYGFIIVSADGINWSYAFSGFELDCQAVAYGNGRFVIVGGGDGNALVLLSSPDGLGWTYGTSDLTEFGGTLRHVAFGNGRFVATGLDQRVLTSADGLYWESSPIYSPEGIRLGAIAFGGGRFAAMPALGYYLANVVFTSDDGTLWFSHSIPNDDTEAPQIRSMAYGLGTFVAVGDNGIILQSDPLTHSVPVIFQQPRNLTVQPGNYVSLTVGVLGSSVLTYEWFKNGVSLCQGSSPYLGFYGEDESGAKLSDTGDYYVVVRNRFGSATSATARLTVTEGQTPQLIIEDYGIARLTVLGPAGYRYHILCADSAGGTNEWRILTTIENVPPPFIRYDAESPAVPARLYKLMLE